MSVNAHCGAELSRRDDLEAIGYLLIYFLKGTLPWQSQIYITKSEKYRKIKVEKQKTSLMDLTLGCHYKFNEYIHYCRSLDFKAEPDYDYLRKIFEDIAESENINLHDKLFDWSIKAVTMLCYPDFF